MREKFSEKVYLGLLFKTTSTQNQYSANEFRESAHVLECREVAQLVVATEIDHFEYRATPAQSRTG